MTALIGAMAAPDLHVMTWNIRRRLDGRHVPRADRWTERADAVRQLLREEAPSVLGVQEALPDQAAVIGDALGDQYRRFGHGRRKGSRGEGCPVFYDARRLELLDAKQTALSDQPEAPGSRSWGNLWPRILVRVLFRDRETAAEFTVMNTHLDPLSARSRTRSAAIIRHAAARAGGSGIVMGDLNAHAQSSTLQALLLGGVLRDSWAVAERRLTPEWRTYGGYRDPRPAPDGRGRIDAILVSPDVRVERMGISTRRVLGRWPSDHLPVQAVIRLPIEGTPS